MAHAQRYFNPRSFGIEVDGWFAGVADDPRTLWRPRTRPWRKPMIPTTPQIEVVRELICYVDDTVRVNGGALRYVWAHRQTHKGKPSDPGELIWREIGAWARDELGLTYGPTPDFYVRHTSNPSELPGLAGAYSDAGPGRPIPTQWDPDQRHPYSYQPLR